MYSPRLLAHIIHQQILAQRVGSREVGFAATDLRHSLDEIDEVVIPGQHEGVDEDARLAALGDFLERFLDDDGIEAEGVSVDPAIGLGDG